MKDIIRDYTDDNTTSLHNIFESASPFKHVGIENFLAEKFIHDILQEFPEPPAKEKLINEFGNKSKKHAVHEIKDLGPTFLRWHDMLRSEEFINWISRITGIQNLLFDEEYHGAGTHNNLNGQGMDVHVDFNYHRTTGLHRRLNLIVYLNEGWKSEWGGSLSLHKNPWNPDTDTWTSFPCSYNRAIIFETNEISWHGFERINLPDEYADRSRKSLTVYYYSKDRPADEIADKHSTIYVQKPIPRHIVPGYTLNESDSNELRSIIRHRNGYLKGMYNRESLLLKRIENFKHHVKQYENHQRLPLVGFVRQINKSTGILPNGKVIDTLKFEIESTRNNSTMLLKGQVYEFINEGENLVDIYVNNERVVAGIRLKKQFSTEVNIEFVKNQRYKMDLVPTSFQSPYEAGINNDKRSLAFLLNEIEFS